MNQQAKSLENLALASLNRYILGLVKTAERENADICIRTLHSYIFDNLHLSLACKVSREILLVVLSIMDELKSSYSQHKSMQEYISIERILKNITVSSLGPHTTVLDLVPFPLWMQSVILDHLGLLRNLKSLRVGYIMPSKHLQTQLKDVEKLNCFKMENSCTDFVVTALAYHCFQSLEILDISGSKHVTELSLFAVEKFKSLKHLQISGTSISSSSFRNHTYMSEALRQVLGKLEYLGVGSKKQWEIDTEDLHIISNCCISIGHLRLENTVGNLANLKHFQSLKSLELYSSDFNKSNLKAFLENLGHQLSSLVLNNVKYVNFNCVMKNCSALKNFEMIGNNFFFARKVSDRDAIKYGKFFESLRSFKLNCKMYCALTLGSILSKCNNIKRIELYSLFESGNNDLVLSLLFLKNLQYLVLQQVIGRSTEIRLSLSAVRELALNCTALIKFEFKGRFESNKETEDDINKELALRNMVLKTQISKSEMLLTLQDRNSFPT